LYKEKTDAEGNVLQQLQCNNIHNPEEFINFPDISVEYIVEEIPQKENPENFVESQAINTNNAIEIVNIYKQTTNVKENSLQQSDSSVINTVEENPGVENAEDDEDSIPYYVEEKVRKGENVDEIPDNLPKGRGIYDINYFMKELKKFWKNHQQGVVCTLENIKVTNSKRYGLRTLFSLRCDNCHASTTFWSEPNDDNMLDINSAATIGTITAGIGYYQMEELFAAMNIPCMSEKTYINRRESLVDNFEEASLAEMKKAGEVEKQLALERNEIVNGIPYITVIADGSWMKRSYGTGYSSLSGIGAIVGYRTQKVLYVGIRNKYCTVCDMTGRQGLEPKSHKCYKNFDRNAASSSMESDVVAEGFKCSIEMHGLIYKTVIADGDSSVYQSILDNNPYQKHMVTVKKIECVNHLFRNLSKKLKAVSETTLPNRQRNKNFVKYRNIVKSNMKNIRENVTKAAAARRAEKKPLHELTTELQKDIINIPSHVFGEHKQCKERGLICIRDEKEANHVPYLKLHALYQKVEAPLRYLSCFSDSLILNHTNNPAEWFNSIIAKLIAGKRINFGARGSYNARIAGAVLQYNTQQVLTQLHESMCDSVPPLVEKLEKRRQIHIAKKKESRTVEGRQKKVKQEMGTDRHYGPQSQRPDLPLHIFEQLKIDHIDRLLESSKNWQKIEYETRGQNECELWYLLRKEMLTASNFGVVCKMRATTSCAMTVKNILYPSFSDTAAIKYGREMEEIARKEVAAKLKKEIKKCGLFIDRENPFLGASPDGIIDEDGLIEIKCPLSAENLTAEEAIKTVSNLTTIFDKKDENKMRCTHKYFYQIQGQLNITRRDYCLFVLWTPKSIKKIYVQRDNDFWKNRMLPILTRFYYECMLPEILDSRHNRHMPIRNPKYIVKAQEKARADSKNKRQRNMKEATMEKNKRVKYNISSSQAKNAICDVSSAKEQDDNCIIINTYHKEHLTEAEIASRRKVLDQMVIPLSAVRDNVLPKCSKLDDQSLDLFLRVVRENSSFETQSVHYIENPKIIAATSTKSIQIITDH